MADERNMFTENTYNIRKNKKNKNDSGSKHVALCGKCKHLTPDI